MWHRTWSSPSTTRTNCTSAEQRTQTALRTPASSSEDSRPPPHPAAGNPSRTSPSPRRAHLHQEQANRASEPPEISEAVRGRPPLVRAAVVRGAGHRPGRAKARHRGIFCVSCLNGRLMLRGGSWARRQGSAEPAGMRSSTRHSGAPPTSAARAPHGTSPFPATRVSQSRSAEDLSGARRSPSAAPHARHPGTGWMRLRMCSQTTLARRPATSGRYMRFISARGTARRRRPRTDHPLRAQHRRQHRRLGGRPDRRLLARTRLCLSYGG